MERDKIKKLGKGCLITLGVFLFIVVAFMWMIKDAMTPHIVTVAESIDIGEQWTTITPSQGLKPEKHQQTIAIKVASDDVSDRNLIEKFGTIQLIDGRKANVEIKAFDDQGEVYELKNTWRSGYYVGYGPVRPQSFKKDRLITKIAIKSDILFTGTVVWHCRTPK